MHTPGIVLSSTLAPGSLEATVAAAQRAEAAGFRNVLVTEVGLDALTLAQHVASVTRRIQVGTCVANIYLRPPLVAALQALTINRVAPGRLLLGLGVSSEGINRAYGVAMERPAATLRQYLTAVAMVFRGDHAGLRHLTRGAQAVPRAEPPIPVYVGGVAPKTLALAGELADGSFVTQCAPHGLRAVRAGLAAGAQKAGRAVDVPIVPLVHCCVCPDRAVALRSVRRVLAAYGQRPVYQRFFALQGFTREAERLAAATAAGDGVAAEAAVSEEMAAQVAAIDSTEECHKKVEEFERAGAASVVLWPTAIEGDSERGVRAVLDAFAR